MEVTDTKEVPIANVGWTEALGEHASNPDEPRKVGNTLHTFGPLPGLPKPAEREWTVSDIEKRIKAQFEMKVRSDALKATKAVDLLDVDEADNMRRVFNKDYGDGLYNWEDSITDPKNYITQKRASVVGALYLMYLLLRRCHPDMTEQLAKAICVENPRDWMRVYCWALGVPVPKRIEELAEGEPKNRPAPQKGHPNG